MPQLVRETGQRVEVWFEDEARFGQQGSLTRVWGRKGSRPSVVRQTEYDYLWMLSAVCPQSGACSGLLTPSLNTDVVNQFLQQLSGELESGVLAVLVWDQAGFHGGHALVIPENIYIVPLPPYSPELNPVENLWHYIKSHYWSNRHYPNYDALLDAAQQGWCSVCLFADMIKTICAAPYLEAQPARVN